MGRPDPAQRAWCLWEIYATLVAGSRFEVALADAQRVRLRAAVLEDPRVIAAVMAEVDVARSEAFDKEDERRIKAAVAAMPGGVHGLNVAVAAKLRGWVLSTAKGLCGGGGAAGDGPAARAELCGAVGRVLMNAGDLAGARPLLEEAEALSEAAHGFEHVDTATSYDALGCLLEAMGDHPGAKLRMEQGLAINEKVLGTEHANTATSYSNLGLLLTTMGDYPGAKLRYEQALAIDEKVLGTEHASTANSYSILGGLLYTMGDHPAAKLRIEQAVAIREKVLGTEHADTATSYSNLGLLLEAMGDYPGAKLRCEQALAIREKVLGRKHADTVHTKQSIEVLRNMIDPRSRCLLQ